MLAALKRKKTIQPQGTQSFADRYYSCFSAGEGFAVEVAVQREVYQNAQPFPYIVLKDFFSPDLLRVVRSEVPTPLQDEPLFRKDEAHLQEKKFAFRDVPRLGPVSAYFLHVLHSKPFLDYVSELTGIDGLIPDPNLWGAGFHQIMRGGKLAVHADFNKHPKLKLHRRLNILIYLNEGWDEAWGGHLELWNEDMSECMQKLAPHFNRTVIFSTTGTSYHGHPDPLDCPENRVRQSLALYYYTAEAPTDETHSTLWQKRPQDDAAVQEAADEHKKKHG